MVDSIKTNNFIVTVVNIINESHDTKTLVCSKPIEFNYVAGQHVLIGFEDERIINNKKSIPITMSSSPLDKYLLFTIKSIGEFSSTLASVKIGERLMISGPKGSVYNFDEKSKENLVLLCAGSGITPFISILRYIKDKGLKNKVIMLNGNVSYEDIIFRQELDNLSKDNIYIMNTLDKYDNSWLGEKGFIRKEMILKYVKTPEDYLFMICGPPIMVSSTEKALKDIGVLENRIRRDRWEIPSKNRE